MGPLPEWWAQPISALGPLRSVSVRSEVPISEAVRRMKEEGVSQLPVLDEQGLDVGYRGWAISTLSTLFLLRNKSGPCQNVWALSSDLILHSS